MSSTNSICASCKKSSATLSQPLKRCARCKDTFYCSRECQTADWKTHKKSCDKTLPDSGRSGLDGFTYYNTVAHTVPAARELAKTLKISLPTGENSREGMALPMRRLITTGLDTLENLRLLFGPSWQPNRHYEEERLFALLRPPRGSPSYAMSSFYDDSSLPWSPRPANETETERLKEVRDMQDLIGRHLGGREEPTSRDMQAILQSYGPQWSEKLAVYQTAVNAMDQGVDVAR